MKRLINFSIAATVMFCLNLDASAQAVGSLTTYGGSGSTVSIASSGTQAEASETLMLGPGTYTINGTWEIYSKYVWISSNAIITGSGVMKFYNPSVAGGASSPTYIDGNGSRIGVDIEVDNPSNLHVANMTTSTFTGDLAGSANLSFDSAFIFAVDNGDVILGSGYNDASSTYLTFSNTSSTVYDFRLYNNATLVNYRPSRMIVTSNNKNAWVKHEDYKGSFIAPVGIAEGDYTPADVNRDDTGFISLNVLNYAASTSVEKTGSVGNGMNRTWTIFGYPTTLPLDGGVTITLQHNDTSNQSNFSSSSYFITQWSATTPNTTGDKTTSITAWQSNNMMSGATGDLSTTGTISGSSKMSRHYASLAWNGVLEEAFFSKSNNQVTTLPVQLLNFSAKAKECTVLLNWRTAVELGFSNFELQRSADGVSFSTIATVAAKGNNSSYSFVDQTPEKGNNYYRLKVVDRDNSFTYSSIKMANSSCTLSGISIYPNPTNSSVFVSGLNGEESIRVYDMVGKLLIEHSPHGNAATQLNLSSYAAGIYHILVLGKDGIINTFKVEKK